MRENYLLDKELKRLRVKGEMDRDKLRGLARFINCCSL
jgi:hypothetical protein